MADDGLRFEMDTRAVMQFITDGADRALIAVGEHMKSEIAEGSHGDTHRNITGEYARSIGYSSPSGSRYNRKIKIGSSLERAVYYEYGTGNKAERGGGRSTPWRFQLSDGTWVTTRGTKASKRMRYAFRDEKTAIKDIIKDELRSLGRG